MDDPRYVDMDPSTCVELQELLQSQLPTPFETPPELREQHGLHNDSLAYEDIVGDYKLFCKTITASEWGIRADELASKTNRNDVKDDHQPLVDDPPSYEEFKWEINRQSKDTAGGMSGLMHSRMQTWPEEVTRMLYDDVPDWVAATPKNPKAPTRCCNAERPS